MPVLLMTAIDPLGQVRDFAYSNDKIEIGFEFISGITTRGITVLEIKLMDGEECMILPLEAFDGSSFKEPIQRLEKEWQCLLSL